MPEFTASFAPLSLPATALLPESASAPVLNVAAARAARAAVASSNFTAAATAASTYPDSVADSVPASLPDRSRTASNHPAPNRPASNSCLTAEHVQKKPRGWAAMFRRRPTNLAATAAHTAARGYPNNAAAPITSQAEFRRNFLKVHKDRVIRDNNGTCFRLHPIVMNGDCGFGAIAKGINVARERVRDMAPQPPEPPHDPHFPIQQRSQTQNQPQHNNRNKHFSFAHDRKRWRRIRSRPWIWHRLVARRAQDRPTKSLQAKDLRKAMFDELKKARKTYLDECEDLSGIYTNDDFDTLEREVSHPGIAGHWLGTVLGVLEHVIVAQAMNIDIYLYQFDLQRQCIRQFESATVENPDCEVYLFFTGPAACGHFDTLVKISNTRDNLFMA